MAICSICVKNDSCRKNKNSAKNCKLFIPDEKKEKELIEASKKSKSKFNKLINSLSTLIPDYDYDNYL